VRDNNHRAADKFPVNLPCRSIRPVIRRQKQSASFELQPTGAAV